MTKTMVTLECLECGKTWKTSAKGLSLGPRCPKCHGYDVDVA